MERTYISHVVSVIIYLQKPASFAFMLLYYRFMPTCTVQKWLSLKYSQYISKIYIYIYRVSQEESARLRESVPYVKLYRYNPKHLYPKLNGYGDNGQRKVWSSGGFHVLYLASCA